MQKNKIFRDFLLTRHHSLRSSLGLYYSWWIGFDWTPSRRHGEIISIPNRPDCCHRRLQHDITVAGAVFDRQHNPISSHLSITCLPGLHQGSDLWNWLAWLFYRRLQIEWRYKPMGNVLWGAGNWKTVLKFTRLQCGSGKNRRKHISWWGLIYWKTTPKDRRSLIRKKKVEFDERLLGYMTLLMPLVDAAR